MLNVFVSFLLTTIFLSILSEFQKRVLFLLTDIRNELRQQNRQTTTEIEEFTAELKKLANMEEFEEMEESLKDEEKRNSLVNKI